MPPSTTKAVPQEAPAKRIDPSESKSPEWQRTPAALGGLGDLQNLDSIGGNAYTASGQ
jgi:hypothetical protein